MVQTLLILFIINCFIAYWIIRKVYGPEGCKNVPAGKGFLFIIVVSIILMVLEIWVLKSWMD